MALIRGTSKPPPPPRDWRYTEAREDSLRDFARLMHEHEMYWRVDDARKVWIGCCCSDIEWPANIQQASHITEAIRKERGPVKKA